MREAHICSAVGTYATQSNAGSVSSWLLSCRVRVRHVRVHGHRTRIRSDINGQDSPIKRDLAEDIFVHSIQEHHRPLPVINMAVNRGGWTRCEEFYCEASLCR